MGKEQPVNESEEDSDVAPLPSIVDKEPPKTAEDLLKEEILKATESARVASIDHDDEKTRKIAADK